MKNLLDERNKVLILCLSYQTKTKGTTSSCSSQALLNKIFESFLVSSGEVTVISNYSLHRATLPRAPAPLQVGAAVGGFRRQPAAADGAGGGGTDSLKIVTVTNIFGDTASHSKRIGKYD